MKTCPSCSGALTSTMLIGESARQCTACGGVWLWRGSMDRICRAEIEEKLRNEWSADPELCRHCEAPLGFDASCRHCNRPATVQCLEGHGTMRTAWLTLAGNSIEVDQCAECGGVWLDGREEELLHSERQQKFDASRADAIHTKALQRVGAVDIAPHLPLTPQRYQRPTPIPEFSTPAYFMNAINQGVSIPSFSMPTTNAARLMVIVVGILWLVAMFVVLPYLNSIW